MESLMSRESEENNRKALDYIVNNKIPYSQRSKNRFLDSTFQTEEDKFLDNFLKLGKDKRRFESIKQTEESDEGFRVYKNFIRSKIFPLLFDNSPYRIKITYPKETDTLFDTIIDYKNYKSNTITIDKQQVKLFKFLIKNEFLTKEEVDYINNYKTAEDIYVCISRNPIDYLFCSTGQSFSSCMSLQQDTYGPEGLLNLYLDPNRALIFITSGNTAKYKVDINNNLFINHFKYISRSWLLLNKENDLFVVRPYPSEPVNFKKFLLGEGYTTYSCDEGDAGYFSNSKFEFEIPDLVNGTHSFLFLDNIGLTYNTDTNKFCYSRRSGMTGDPSFNTRVNRTIENLLPENYIIDGIECNNCLKNLSGYQTINTEKLHIMRLNCYVCDTCYKSMKECVLCNKQGIVPTKDQIIEHYRHALFDIYSYTKHDRDTRTLPVNYTLFDKEIEMICTSEYLRSLCVSCMEEFIRLLFNCNISPILKNNITLKKEYYKIYEEREFSHIELLKLRNQKQHEQDNMDLRPKEDTSNYGQFLNRITNRYNINDGRIFLHDNNHQDYYVYNMPNLVPNPNDYQDFVLDDTSEEGIEYGVNPNIYTTDIDLPETENLVEEEDIDLPETGNG